MPSRDSQRRLPKSLPDDQQFSLQWEGLSIEVVAARAGVSVRRVRYLEREGLVAPVQRAGRTALYDEQAIERILLIERLLDDLGVNLPGAEVILHMRERLLELAAELERARQR
jgi:MerR family transcriptional regulator, heat shock protein HspR